ncbi:MAG: OmpH family outer membrane protein [Armatimonadetes bacterium]|nr:OmpH family outer membrane protein [Armatimonadota bacterium]
MRITWMAIALAALVGSASAQGFGVVDMAKVVNESSVAKKRLGELQELERKYNSVLQQMEQNILMTPDERKTYYETAMLPAPNDAQKKAMSDIMNSAKTRGDALTVLQNTATPSPEQTVRLNELTALATQGREQLRVLAEQLNQQLQGELQKGQDEVMTQVKAAIAAIAKERKLSVVFNSTGVVYADNDITDLVIQRVSK